MARLGELLVASGLLTPERLEQALRAQIMWGARLGTNLVELGFIDLDSLSLALAQQHRLPAALARHFEKVDSALQQALPPLLAETYACLPLIRIGRKRQIVIATTTPPTKKALVAIAQALETEPEQLIPSIAAELRIRYQLERVYGIARSSRFMRSPGKTIPPFPQLVIEEASDEDSGPIVSAPSEADVTMPFLVPAKDDDDDATTVSQPTAEVLAALEELDSDAGPELDEAALRERRRYIRTIADAAPPAEAAPQIGRIAIRRVAVPVETAPAEATTLGEVTRAIRRAKDRDKVGELAMSALFRFATSCEAAVFLVIRGEAATAWKGFHRGGAPTPELNVPLDQAGLVPRAIASNATEIAAAAELGPIDQKLLVSLGQTDGDLAVVPVAIGGQVMCAIAMVTATDAAIKTAESIAAATGAAFSRMLRDAAR
jgi:hypothetical protein